LTTSAGVYMITSDLTWQVQRLSDSLCPSMVNWGHRWYGNKVFNWHW